MRNTLRTMVASSALLATLVGGAAYAQVDISSINGTTGPWSENKSIWDIDHDIDIDITNDSEIKNDQDIDAETGRNEVEHNTSVSDFTTGDIDGDIYVSNELGGSDFIVSGSDLGFGDVSIDLANGCTGPNSENENIVDIDNDIDLDFRNYVTIHNDLDADLNTGDNEVEHNTVVGDFSTGDIDFSATTENRVNNNLGNLDLGNLVGGNEVSGEMRNTLTGPNSENKNLLDIENDIDLDVTNHTTIHNDTDIDANTGNNEIENNTCVGDISTGSVSIDVSTMNIAN